MICNRSRILCFLYFVFFFNSFFPIYLQKQKIDKKKSELTQEEKLSCDLMSVHLYRVQFLFPWVCCDELL